MDFTQILTNTVSGDNQKRAEAEQKILEFETTAYQQYVIELMQVVINDNFQPHVKQIGCICLKNAIKPKIIQGQEAPITQWPTVDPNVRNEIKSELLGSIAEPDHKVGMAISQTISTIAELELPNNLWPELIDFLVGALNDTDEYAKLTAVRTLGYVCQGVKSEFLAEKSTMILGSILKVLNPDQANAQSDEMRLASIQALTNGLPFIETNISNHEERNYLMNVIDFNLKTRHVELQKSAFELLREVTTKYYDYMNEYFVGGILASAISGLSLEEEEVVFQVLEFWTTLATLEADRYFFNKKPDSEEYDGVNLNLFNFIATTAPATVNIILGLMTKQEEDVDYDEMTIPHSAAITLKAFSRCLGNGILPYVLKFVDDHIKNPDWHYKEAATIAFGTIIEHSSPEEITVYATQGLDFFCALMTDPSPLMRDTAAWTVSQICEFLGEFIDTKTQLSPLLQALFNGFNEQPRTINSCCWSLINLARKFTEIEGEKREDFMYYVKPIIEKLLETTHNMFQNTDARTSVYEALSEIVRVCPEEQSKMIEVVVIKILERLGHTLELEEQVVSQDDMNNLINLQMSLCIVLNQSIIRLDDKIQPVTDNIMVVLKNMLEKSKNPTNLEDILFCINSMVNVLEGGIKHYYDGIQPYLFKGLASVQEPRVCKTAINLIGDIYRALGAEAEIIADNFLAEFGNLLNNPLIDYNVHGAVFTCLGELANSIGVKYEKYLTTTLQMMDPRTQDIRNRLQFDPDDIACIDMYDYILTCFVGIAEAFKAPEAFQLLTPHMNQIFHTLSTVSLIREPQPEICSSIATILGDLAEATYATNSEFASFFRDDWVKNFIKYARSKSNPQGTRRLAKWARSQIALINPQ